MFFFLNGGSLFYSIPSTMMRALGKLLRLPGVPAPSKKAPIEAAIPKQMVRTSQSTNCIVS